jgi:glycosyltransferase involved in cell wall biosynthesis
MFMTRKRIKVLHIAAGDLSYGSARGAYWLHQGLLKCGLASKVMIAGRSHVEDATVISLARQKRGRLMHYLRARFDSVLLRLYKNRSGTIFSTGLVGYDFTRTPEYREADIVHLHWVNEGLLNLKHLRKIDKPIVWTLRDMWPLTGGCHYALACERFKQGCGACPQLGSHSTADLSRIVFKRKMKFIPQSVTAVGISHWITDQARLSPIFADKRCTTILNNINTDEFHHLDKAQARKLLGIETDKKVVLCGSTHLKDFYKGFEKFLDALAGLDTEQIFLCFFGRLDPEVIRPYGFEFKSLGYLHDAISLNLVYAAADVFVAPSIQEAFGKTLAEAQCSGTPVVCFDATGPKDSVEHQVTGYRAKPFDAQDLAHGIEWVLKAPDYQALCDAARQKVLREFDSQVVARHYIELYRQLVDPSAATAERND